MEKDITNEDWSSLPWTDIPGFGSCFQVVSGKEVQNLFTHTASRKRSRSNQPVNKEKPVSSRRQRRRVRKARSEREILAARWVAHFDEDEVESSSTQDEPVQPWTNGNVEHDSEERNPPLRLSLLSSLQDNGFSEPTLIQERMLRPAILQRKDAIIAAPTGSGKTLAYVVPILHMLPEVRSQHQFGPAALIICPTRELAVQVFQVVRKVGRGCGVTVACIFGGMAVEKQERVLRSIPDVVVATPGRLWELIRQGNETLNELPRSLRWLIIDEADRMVEDGHFRELDLLLNILDPGCAPQFEDSIMHDPSFVKLSPSIRTPLSTKPRQTFVCSATLGIQQALANGCLQKLLSRVNFLRPIERIDTTTRKATVDSLSEWKLTCNTEDKDVYLSLLLLSQLGPSSKVIVFVNTINTLRFVADILNLLRLRIVQLHARMQQRQRLKAIDRFSERPSQQGDSSSPLVLVTSDVAARGLDLPMVDLVVHYQLPHTPELYIHRSGRSARGGAKGKSVILLGPGGKERAAYQRIVAAKDRMGADLPTVELDRRLVRPVRQRVHAARKVATLQRQLSHKKRKESWWRRTAEEADLDLSSDESDGEGSLTMEDQREERNLRNAQASLIAAIEKPLFPSGTSSRFPAAYLAEPGTMKEAIP